jgi:hypothetical protein
MRLALVAAATMAMSAAASAQEAVKVGSHPKFAFTKEILNGLGVKSLADLQGRPVMVEFWGVH